MGKFYSLAREANADDAGDEFERASARSFLPQCRANQMSEQEKEPKPTKISFGEDGSLKINLEAIESVGIENVLDLKAYNMSREENRVMHIFEYHDGGHCELTFSFTGLNKAKLEVFQTHRTSLSVIGGTRLTIGKYGE